MWDRSESSECSNNDFSVISVLGVLHIPSTYTHDGVSTVECLERPRSPAPRWRAFLRYRGTASARRDTSKKMSRWLYPAVNFSLFEKPRSFPCDFHFHDVPGNNNLPNHGSGHYTIVSITGESLGSFRCSLIDIWTLQEYVSSGLWVHIPMMG